MPTPPMTAGWQPDPNGLYEYRYWDGSGWTDRVSDGGSIQTAPLLPPPPPSAAKASTELPVPRAIPWIALGCAALIVMGSLGPWKKALGGIVTVGGTDGGGDGIIVIGFAIGYAALIAWYIMEPTALKAGTAVIFALLIGITAYVDYHGLKGDAEGALRDTITAGWGLMLVGFASVIAFLLAAAMSFTARRTEPISLEEARRDQRRAPPEIVVLSCILPLFGLIYGPIALIRGRTRSGAVALIAAIVAILSWGVVTTVISTNGIGPIEVVEGFALMFVVMTPVTYAINGQ